MQSFVASSMLAWAASAQAQTRGIASTSGLVANFQFDTHDHHLLHSVANPAVGASKYDKDLALAVGNTTSFSNGTSLVCAKPLKNVPVASLTLPGDRAESYLDASSIADKFSGTATNKLGASMSVGMWAKLLAPTEHTYWTPATRAEFTTADTLPYTLIHTHCFPSSATTNVCFPVADATQNAQNSVTYLELTLKYSATTKKFSANYLKWGGEAKMKVDATATLSSTPTIAVDTWVFIVFKRNDGISSLSYVTHDAVAAAATTGAEPKLELMQQWTTQTDEATPKTPATNFYDLSKDNTGAGKFSTDNKYKWYFFGTDRYVDECQLSYRANTLPAEVTALRFYDRAITTAEIVDIAQDDWCPTYTGTMTIPVPVPEEKDTDSQTMIIAVVAAIVGCLVCIALGVLAWFCIKKRKEQKEIAASNVNNSNFEPETTTSTTNNTVKVNYNEVESDL